MPNRRRPNRFGTVRRILQEEFLPALQVEPLTSKKEVVNNFWRVVAGNRWRCGQVS